MSQVKSTYNFVPAPEEHEVFKPNWADHVSHDIPFEDGESGEIEIEITAETPIFIRNGYAKGNEDNEFSNAEIDGEKKYFIPATSLKGMTRNVLEIMSFSRLNKKLVNDDRYSFRDLSSSQSEYMQAYKKFEIKAGWLKEDSSGNWIILECESFAFVHHSELQDKLKIPFKSEFLFSDNNRQPSDKAKFAKYKYEKLKALNIGLAHCFEVEEKTLFGGVKRNVAKITDNGKQGVLVFSGQSSNRKEAKNEKDKASGKVHEFVFFNSKDASVKNISNQLQKDFKFIYKDEDSYNIQKDWEFLRKRLKHEGVPVFYSKNENNEIMHFGLAYMYKLPYENRISQMAPLNKYSDDSFDLSQTIFGKTSKSDSLKGRVYFSNAILEGEGVVLGEGKEILGGPKASYFPFYLSQFKNEKTKEYLTYQNTGSLKGFKRYPVHQSVKTPEYDDKQLDNKNVFTYFRPLENGACFKAKIRFHNLRKFEIGALLSALTFHANNDKCFHSLGAAKPLGYGKVKVNIPNSNNLSFDFQEYMLAFEQVMNENVENWFETKMLTELFAMASNTNDSDLTYPSISEFVDYKKRKVNRQTKEPDFLDVFSNLRENSFNRKHFKSLIKQMEPQTALNLEQTSFSNLSTDLNLMISESFDQFSDENKIIIYNKIEELFNNHKDSRKKLSKMYDWEKNIPKWLGLELAENLKNELNVNFNQ